MRRTGLALEAAQMNNAGNGTKIVRRRFGSVYVTDVRVNRRDAIRIGKDAGRYITIEGEPSAHIVPMILEKALRQMLPSEGVVLAAGLGNSDIARDSLGARTIRKLVCQRTKLSIVAVETDVSAKTGIDTACMIRGVAKEINASCVLAVDALACCDPLMIGRTVQVSDTGLQPGSGVYADSPAVCRSYMGVPVIAVGVPVVSELSAITGNPAHRGYLAAPANEDELAEQWSNVIAEAINIISGAGKSI